jgi:hypothetical protein
VTVTELQKRGTGMDEEAYAKVGKAPQIGTFFKQVAYYIY